MPDMDGVETTRRIKERSGMERIPIVAMSAEASGAEGMDDAISKPVEPASLDAVLRRWL